ncbi:MAG TPA: amino acid ABC transporter ATP-binding protein [Solirubrobacter sp.]|nr:amino acid ABC transporter ATP-binding protein [Solirubrobacter sp.]
MTEHPLLAVERLHKSFGELEVLRGVDLIVEAGQVTCLLGPSGSGKSTLLRCINRLENYQRGSVRIDGERIGYRRSGNVLHELSERDIARQRRAVGMVFQSFNLFPHMTALENVMEAPLRVLKEPREETRVRAERLLERVGLREKAASFPRELSGGQQQRVAIARALAMRPKLMLFDEPTSALDPELVGEVLGVMTSLAREGTTMVVVTHEIGFARRVADEIVFMDAGRVLERGAPVRVLDAPRHARTREFLAGV